VALALWYHDAIYWPWSGHNEARSADWARQFLLGQGLPTTLAETVHQHVMDTRHTPGALTGDALWVVDIDLAILGAEPARFAEYEPVMPAACLRPLPPWSSAAIPGRRKRSPTDMPSPQ
jgi:predicted metal-dependent HD superfamily phosphohydrolase